jgi:hypothetical protein
MLELVMPDSKLESSQTGLDNILRWEDDGGAVFGARQPLPQAAEINTPPPMDAARECFLYDE